MNTRPSPLWNTAPPRKIVEWRALPPNRPVCTRRMCLPQLISHASAAEPDAVALACGTARLTYAELENRSNQIGAYLRSFGVGPEVVVAICLDRPFEYVIAALAIWKAGGAYLALDCAWPVARRNAIVAAANVSILITREALGGMAPIVIDTERDAMDLAHTRMLIDFAQTRREHLASVNYTTGTAAGPQGVEITHGNLLNMAFWYRRTFGITAADRSSHLVPLAFDAAAWELWPQLSVGARVIVADQEVRSSPERLRAWLLDERINIAFIPATLAEPLIGAAWPEKPALRYMLADSGLPATPGLPFRLAINYGRAECTGIAASRVVNADRDLTLGTSIANTTMHLLDESLQPVAPGEIGEIFIEGANVSRGYRNQPHLTEQRFLPNPFASTSGSRLYRSGDLGSVLPSGEIQYRGRADRQDKIRGHRVDPEEVAAVLRGHPHVAACEVKGEGDELSRSLVAYVVAMPETACHAAELREFLGLYLPQYMIPQEIAVVANLPLDSHGRAAAEPEPMQTIEEMAAPNVPGATEEDPLRDHVSERMAPRSLFGKLFRSGKRAAR